MSLPDLLGIFGLFLVAFYSGVGAAIEIQAWEHFGRPPERVRLELYGGTFLGSCGVLGGLGLLAWW